MIAPFPTDSGLFPEETLDDLRLRLAPMLAANAAFDGWSPAALAMTATQAGVDPEVARLAFKDGAMAMISAWFASIDDAMAQRLPAETLAGMKIRERIAALVTARLTVMAPHREALRRAQSILALPQNLPQAAKLGWHAADLMWRAAGDTAADYNHYTKRATLSAVYGSTLLAFLDDESADFADTRAFLDRRIEDVMRFEKAKGRLVAHSDLRFSPARFLGRLRYRTH
jgi:ubiquinone biosynthesis protein COQ9